MPLRDRIKLRLYIFWHNIVGYKYKWRCDEKDCHFEIQSSDPKTITEIELSHLKGHWSI